MRVLIIVAHPDHHKKSTTHKIADAAKEALLEDGHEVKINDLMDEGFDKVLSKDDFIKPIDNGVKFDIYRQGGLDNLVPKIKKQQELVTWSTHMLVIGPMWWFRYPACFYCWLERVFCKDFGFNYQHTMKNGLLKGRKVMFVITTGGPGSMYSPNGWGSMEGFHYVNSLPFRYCGVEVLRSQGLYGVPNESVEAEFYPKFKLAIKKLDKRPALPVDGSLAQKDPTKNEIAILSQLPDFSLDEAAKL